MSQTTTDSEHFQYLLHRCVVSDFTGEPANELANFILEHCRNNLASGKYALVQQQDKDDIAQDTTVDLIRHLNKDRNQVIDKPMAYISSTTHRHFISHIRRKKQEPKQFPSKPEDRTCFEFNIPETRISDPAIFCYASPVATAGLFTEQETEMLDNLIDISGVSTKKHYELKHEILRNRYFGQPRESEKVHAQSLGIDQGSYKRLSSQAVQELKSNINGLVDSELKNALIDKIKLFDQLSTKTQNKVI